MRQLSPTELGLDAVNVRAAVSTQEASNPIGVHNVLAFTIVVKVTETDATPGTGTIKLVVRVLDIQDNSTLYEVDLVTALDTSNDGVTHVISFGPAQAVAAAGGGTATADAGVLKVLGKIQIVTEVTQQTGGTDAQATVALLIEDRL